MQMSVCAITDSEPSPRFIALYRSLRTGRLALRASPVAVTLAYLCWSTAVESLVSFGSSPHWAWVVTLAPIPLALVFHIALLIVESRRLLFSAYAALHLAVLTIIWYRLMFGIILHITGDTL